MVVATMPWISASIKGTTNQTLNFFFHDKTPSLPSLRILAFDTAKTMAALLSLHRSLSDEEVLKLKNDAVRSQGVVYLNSMDEEFLLNLAFAERLEELNNAASSVSRLSRKCADLGLSRFDLLFSDMKLGIFHKPDLGVKNLAKLIGKMEKLVVSTAELHSAMEVLTEMEASEKKLQKWKLINPKHSPPQNFEMLDKKLNTQRKEVKHFKEVSLWNQSFDYAVGLMTRLISVIYARIVAIFGQFVSDQACSLDQNPQIRILRDRVWRWNFGDRKFGSGNEDRLVTQSGPIPKKGKKELVRFPSGIRAKDDIGIGYCEFSSSTMANNRVYTSAPPSTVGGSGLSMNYANVILYAERCLHAPATIGEEAREDLYEMLPAGIKEKVRAKLRRNNWAKRGGGEEEEEVGGGGDGRSMAAGWREAVEEIMSWLSPVAHDTMRWQSKRNMEKQRFDTSPAVALMQTLHYSDLEKTEAAIVEVLVGLSCIYRYENLQQQGRRTSNHV